MAKLYGEELKASILETQKRIRERIADRQRRIDDCETDYDDCFISIHIDENALRECGMQLEILNGDGLMDFDAIVDENGNEVRIHYFENKWGKTNVVGNGVFASSLKALLKKTGWTEKTIRVPVWTKFRASGYGMGGVMSGSTERVRWHTNMVTGEYVGYPD
jgi:hypothetical protein